MEQSTLSNATNNCGFEPHDYLEIKFALISVVGTLIGLFGLFGNASTALILTRPSMRNPNNLFLTALAVYDSCLLITAFFIYGMEYVIEFTRAFDLYVAWLTYLKFAFALSHISQTGSVYITVTVTIERYLAVCHPRKSKRLCSIGGAAWSILGVTTFAVIFNATKFFELEVTLNPDCPDGNDWQSYILLPSTMAASPIYQQIYSLWMTQTVMVFFPFITLLVFNSIIAYTIRKSLKKFDYQQEKISGRNELKERSREATVVLVTIVFIFLICNFWGFVITLLERIMDADTLMVKYHAFYTFSREAINFLAIINSSLNFFIQFVIAKDFRKEFIVVYGCGIRGVTVRLPVNDKFNIWRSWTRRTKDLRRSVSARGTRFVRRVSSIPSTSGGQLSTPQTPAPKLSASSICRNHEESPLKAIAEAQGRSSNGYGTSNAHTMLLMHDTTNGYYCALAEGTPC